jgi:hypothetical protein
MSQAALSAHVDNGPALERLPFGSPVAEVVAAVTRDGGVILTRALTREQVDAVNRDLDPYFGKLPEGNFGQNEGNFLEDFMGRKTKRLVHCLRFSKTYREQLLGSPVLAEYIAALVPGAVGCHALISSQAIEIYPGEQAQPLHRDGATHLEMLGMLQKDGPEVLVNTLLGLMDITEEMGATRVIPGSNVWDDFSAPGEPAQTIPALLNAGDVLLISGKVLHGGGANTTRNTPRRVLSSGYAIPFFMGEEAWPFVIPAEEVREYPKQVQAALGFRSVSMHGEQPGFLWRAEARPLEEKLGI